MTNVSLEPGTWDLDDLIADTPDGIYMETNRSWSIDDVRLNFQFGTEVGYEIKNGQRLLWLNDPWAGQHKLDFDSGLANDEVEEIFTWELFQKRYFDPTFGGALIPGVRNVVASTADLTAYAFLVGPRNASPVVSLFRAVPLTGLGVQWQSDYDPLRSGIVDSSLSVDYRFRKYFISAGHNSVHTDPILTAPANQFRGRIGFGDPNHKGLNAGFEAIYDYRAGLVQYTTSQVTYNTDCCGLSVQIHRFNIGSRSENQFRVAFAVANIGTTLGNLKKQDRMF